MKRIPLTQGKYTIVDDEDYEFLVSFGSWHFDRYAKRVSTKWDKKTKSYKHSVTYMHRLLKTPRKGMVVDHINDDKLDNRRENLRVCSAANNVRNARSKGGTSQYLGVSFDKRRNQWKATIQNRQYRFNTEEEAAVFRDRLAKQTFGKYARLNFPPTARPTGQNGGSDG